MGIDYFWSGSASYPRFNKELDEVAKVFGGIKEKCEVTGKLKFVFPDRTNEILVRWFNNIYEYFTISETKTIWEIISQHLEIKEISSQIWAELEECVEYEIGWEIH